MIQRVRITTTAMAISILPISGRHLQWLARSAASHTPKQLSRRISAPNHHHALPFSTNTSRLSKASATAHRNPTASGPDLRKSSSHAIPAKELSHNISEEEKRDWNKKLDKESHRQVRAPWHRDGVDQPPAKAPRNESVRTKGKLLTTPSRLLKLILPLTTTQADGAPLALLLHPQQPLSYLERLIQAELPVVKDEDGHERIPSVNFRAEDKMDDSIEPKKSQRVKEAALEEEELEKNESKDENENELTEQQKQPEKASTYSSRDTDLGASKAREIRGGPGQGGVESYSGLGREAKELGDDASERAFVRWSKSTEVGDFIRDAARGREFAVEIEGMPEEIRVGVPSFADRTYYLRMRLRSVSRKIASAADLKKECDLLAHKGAQRVALGGFAGLCGWWYLVYRLTFETDLGWDVMEPVTYLVSLGTLIGGYVWFLYHNREVSYRSAMKITISRRQAKLYDARGFDVAVWEALIEEGNALKREIRAVATEYDVEWDELEEEKAEKVREALREGLKKKNGKKGGRDDDDEEEKDRDKD